MTTNEIISATEAASILGLTRERLRQLVVSGELPPRVAGSSPFRPKYRRADIEAFGRSTGRIAGSVPEGGMDLVVDGFAGPASPRGWFGRVDPFHVRIWRRDGWPPVVLAGLPLDETGVGDWVSEGLMPVVRERWLPEDDVVSLWVFSPRGGSWRSLSLERRDYREYVPAPRKPRPSRKKGGSLPGGVLGLRTRRDFEAVVGVDPETIPPQVYRREVIEQVMAGETPVEITWDCYDLAGRVESCLLLADRSERSGADRDLLRAGAYHLANFIREIERGNREELPASTAWVKLTPIEFPTATWERIDALDAESPPYVMSEYRPWVVDVKKRLRALIDRKGASMPWALREAVERASTLGPNYERAYGE